MERSDVKACTRFSVLSLTSEIRQSYRIYLQSRAFDPSKSIASAAPMLVFVGFSLLLALIMQTPVLRDSALGPTSVHSMCIESCPLSDHVELYRAIVCGSSVPDSMIRSDFVQTGLIHLLVVSGQHFQFLEWIVERATFRLPSLLKWMLGLTILGGFTLASGGSAPAVRAAAAWSSRRLSEQFKLNWSPVQIAIVSSASALSLCRTRADIGSLALSSTAAAALTMSQRKFTPQKGMRSLVAKMKAALFQQAQLYVILLPALCSIALPHPFTIAWNLAAGTLIGHFLFPLSLFGFLVPGFVVLSDAAWEVTIDLVHRMSQATPKFLASVPTPIFIPIAYSLLVLTLAFVFEKRRRLVWMWVIFISIHSHAGELVVWNVGQGSWATIVTAEECSHFDMGGELAPWIKIRATCEGRRNAVRFSHWDWDHVSYTVKAARWLDMCLAARPGGKPPRGRERILVSLKKCSADEIPVREHTPALLKSTSANASSRVYSSESALFTGDATRSEEKHLRQLGFERVLILPHHGSKTSTSDFLLDRVRPKMAIASARRKKYGHPHAIVAARLKSRGIALLLTEEWGSIRIQLKRPERFEIRVCKPDTPC